MHRRTLLFGLALLPWAGRLIAAQQSEPHFIPTDQLKKLAKSKKSFVLDVREPKELQELGTLKRAKNIPMGEVEKRLAEVPKNKKILVLCNRGVRAARVADALKKNGYQDVEFTGLKEWKDQGLPLVYPKRPE